MSSETMDEAILIDKLELNCRDFMNSFDVPSVIKIIDKLDTIIKGEFVVQELKKGLQGVFHIFLDTPCDPALLEPVTFEVRKRFQSEKERARVEKIFLV